MPKSHIVLLLNLCLATGPAWSQEHTGAIDAMEEYLDFVDYGGATIFPEQIPAMDWNNFFIVDGMLAMQHSSKRNT